MQASKCMRLLKIRRGTARPRNLIESIFRIYLPAMTLFEIVWVLRKLGLDGKKIGDVLESIVGNSRVTIVTDDGKHSLQAMK